MPFFRLQYQGYLEDDFESKDEALEVFVGELQDTDITDYGILVEQWNEDAQEWETV